MLLKRRFLFSLYSRQCNIVSYRHVRAVSTTPDSHRSATMLSSAVERASKPGLAKQLFPSSSPIPIEDAFKAASQFSRSSNTLKPSAQSTLNGIGTTRREEVSSDGLKRPTSQLSGVTCIPNNRDRFGEKPPALVGSTHNNSISKLHEGVYFDENDFDDDGDLDFGSPPGRPITSEPVPETILPPTSDGKVSSPSDIVYFPWSSSPLEHRLPAKRRGLPWEDDAIGEIEGNASGSTSIAVPTGHKAKKAKGSGHDSSDARPVPLLEASTNSNPHPWNRTARDVKEEQKRLRQASKRLVKTNEATDEDRARAIEEKKRKNVLKIFLSEEQKRVEQLVVEKGKSVFFTGSAGILLGISPFLSLSYQL
jgi:ATP-dependent DNA helicase PIF1